METAHYFKCKRKFGKNSMYGLDCRAPTHGEVQKYQESVALATVLAYVAPNLIKSSSSPDKHILKFW